MNLLFLYQFFGDPYTIPEGMKVYKEWCFFNAFRILDGKMPRFDCDVQFVEIDYFDLGKAPDYSPVYNIPEPYFFIPWMFMLIMGIILAVVFVELMDKKFLYLVTPVCNIIEKRYRTVKERRRLETMQGHP